MTVVLDTNVVVSGIIWAGSSRRCLVAWARRRFELVITTEILDEYMRTVEIVVQRTGKEINWRPWMQWIKDKAKVTEAAPLGKQRSRDPKDDIFLACALASGVKTIVSKDKDLLTLQKPFGVEILEPNEFLKKIAGDD